MQRVAFVFIFISGIASLGSCAQEPAICGSPSHQIWTDLLTTHVGSDGWVSYQGFIADSVKLNQYLKILSKCAPNANWTEGERLAFWINAYNAFTIKLIVDHYPVSSIKDIKKGIPFINSVWDIDFFKIGGREMDLNEIEHSILRKEFDEPRIHFAIVCASKSCPKLRNEAYTAKSLDQQLEEQTVDFINSDRNLLGGEKIKLSLIFNWFKKDFTKHRTLKEFLKLYAKGGVNEKAKIKYLEYDWSLNGK